MAARGQNHGNEKNKLAYAPKPKIPPPPKREDPAKESICHECSETGHWKRSCSQYLAELLKKKKNAASGAGGSDGFINRFMNNTIQVYRNNMVYFSAIPSDGIFEIDLSYSYTNESSMYVVSNKRAKLDLESALLWHCRLGHIGKKHIEKLQYDGLLNSIDLSAFEKCVSCMSGKMAKKPYTHQRKHEVFETFKVLQKEVENQLGKTIKSLRSDRKGYPKEIIGYSFYYPTENKVLVARNAEFLENSLITQEASRSLKDLEIIQEEDTYPSIDTSLNHKEDDLEIDEPQSDIIPIRRSTRTRRPTNRMCLYIDVEEHELGDLGEPANYKAVLLDPESDKCLNVMNEEMQSIKDNECQSAYIEKILKRYHMENSKRGIIPMQDKLKLSKSQGALTPTELKCMQNVIYASAVGSIMYAMRCTRPDVALAQNITSRFQRFLGDLHWTTVKNILKYLENTKDMFLIYKGDIKPELRVSCYTDAGYLTDKSAKQSIFATSSAEAEYIAAFGAFKEAVWVRKFISGLGVVPIIEKSISMYCDNTVAIAIANVKIS
uniref:CCHC-type domain-containing protein n=1 Tax=Tanacetum cinerariifolium TaxID=118510 RepID=A0A699HP27_TANCI|nr:hypothetical protein [Tanacetum cinerariifolium]